MLIGFLLLVFVRNLVVRGLLAFKCACVCVCVVFLLRGFGAHSCILEGSGEV